MPSRYLEIHPKDPQPRLIRQAVEIIRDGGVVVYPTDSCYALGCHIGDKAAMERIARIRQTDKHHHFTLVCSDLSEIANYARVNNQQYRTLKAFTPGPYTFILQATRETPEAPAESASAGRSASACPTIPCHGAPDGAGRADHELDVDAAGRRACRMTDAREIQERLLSRRRCGHRRRQLRARADQRHRSGGPAPVVARRARATSAPSSEFARTRRHPVAMSSCV